MKNSVFVRKILIPAFSLSILFSANGCAVQDINTPVNASVPVNKPVSNPVNNLSNSQPDLSESILKLKGPEINKNRTFKSVDDISKELQNFMADGSILYKGSIKPLVNQDGSQSFFIKNPDGSFKYELRHLKNGKSESYIFLDKDNYLIARITGTLNDDNSSTSVYEDSSNEYIFSTKINQDGKNSIMADNFDGTVSLIERDKFSKELSQKLVNKPFPFLSKFDDQTGIYTTSNLNEDGTISVSEVDKEGNIKKKIENKAFLDTQTQFTINH